MHLARRIDRPLMLVYSGLMAGESRILCPAMATRLSEMGGGSLRRCLRGTWLGKKLEWFVVRNVRYLAGVLFGGDLPAFAWMLYVQGGDVLIVDRLCQ